jgi:hypothetical protein
MYLGHQQTAWYRRRWIGESKEADRARGQAEKPRETVRWLDNSTKAGKLVLQTTSQVDFGKAEEQCVEI